jgi:lipid A 3-O-deacylase
MKIRLILLMMFFTLGYSSLIHSSNLNDSTKQQRITRLKFETGLELMMPYDKSRQINTISENFLFGAQFFKKWHLQILTGITTTYAYGNIIQWNQSFKDTTYQNNAFGAGPVLQIRIEPLVIKRFSISLDVGTGLIVYSSRFPYGGDYYNFMSRVGASLIYQINNKFSIGVSGKWMHVSNGQGLGSFNPSYEAAGMSVQLSRYF